jgi:prevent-host-death family protein
MSTFLNSLGITEPLRKAAHWLRAPAAKVAVSDFKRQVAQMVDNVETRPVVIEKHGRPAAVLISYQAYQDLREALMPSLNSLTADFDTALAQLQGGSGNAGMEAAFASPPNEVSRRELKKRFGGKR